jgi:hypothetical protein
MLKLLSRIEGKRRQANFGTDQSTSPARLPPAILVYRKKVTGR